MRVNQPYLKKKGSTETYAKEEQRRAKKPKQKESSKNRSERICSLLNLQSLYSSAQGGLKMEKTHR